MKQVIFIFFLLSTILASSSSFSQISATDSIQIERRNDHKLSKRHEDGYLHNVLKLYKLLEVADADRNKPVVILYYPGKDRCNSTGSTSESWLKANHNTLQRNTAKLIKTKPIYIYNNPEGLDKYKGITEWKPDPKQVIEKLFFTTKYPCGSFVVINPEGKYISYFGEYSNETIAEVIKEIIK